MPSERLTALSPRGLPAAEYGLHTRHGNLGHVRVWSDGAERVRFDDRRRALLHVGMAVENRSDRPLVIDPDYLVLEWVTVNGDVFRDVPVARVQGERIVPPGGEATVHLHFAMIPGVYPTDMRRFRLRWAVRDERAVYVQRTPFVRPPVRRGPRFRGPGFYYYDPFWHHRAWGPRWGPGWGPGWGPRRPPRRW